MSDTFKTIENLKIHEETIIQEDESNLTVAMRVPGGLIYKFYENFSNINFSLKSTEFVPFLFLDEKAEKKLLKS